MRRSLRLAVPYAVAVVLIAVLAEVGGWVTAYLLADRGILYVPEEVEDYPRYLAERDPVLGWPRQSDFGKGDYDETGSRIIPAFSHTRKACIALYGDSFTWGDGVNSEKAWSNVLSELLGCRVANYGVGGYGSDQAYLRFLQHAGDGAEIVVLGHLAENILRNVNQLRGLLYSGSGYGLKPRFVLDEGNELKLIPLPEFSEEEYRELVVRPELYLVHEYFLPGGPSGVVGYEFPFTIAVLRAFGHFHVRSELRGEPWHAEFYESGHPSGGLPLTAAILEDFHNAALERGKHPIILMIPTYDDLSFHDRHGTWTYQDLVDRLRARGIEPFNAGEAIAAYLGSRDPCDLFGGCSGHFNEEGNAALAQTMLDHLSELTLADRD